VDPSSPCASSTSSAPPPSASESYLQHLPPPQSSTTSPQFYIIPTEMVQPTTTAGRSVRRLQRRRLRLLSPHQPHLAPGPHLCGTSGHQHGPAVSPLSMVPGQPRPRPTGATTGRVTAQLGHLIITRARGVLRVILTTTATRQLKYLEHLLHQGASLAHGAGTCIVNSLRSHWQLGDRDSQATSCLAPSSSPRAGLSDTVKGPFCWRTLRSPARSQTGPMERGSASS
jgi:hypothetical protein